MVDFTSSGATDTFPSRCTSFDARKVAVNEVARLKHSQHICCLHKASTQQLEANGANTSNSANRANSANNSNSADRDKRNNTVINYVYIEYIYIY